MHPIVPMMLLMSVLFPSRQWIAISQPVNVEVRSAGDVTLTMTDFDGKVIDPPGGPGSADVSPGTTVDVRKLYLPTFSQAGTFLPILAELASTWSGTSGCRSRTARTIATSQPGAIFSLIRR